MQSSTATARDAQPRDGQAPASRRKIAAIMAADVAGYSRLVAADEDGTLHQLAEARAVFAAIVPGGGGRIFNTAGDSVMCEFDSAVEAVRAAIAVQARLAELNAPRPPERRLEFRIGITIGDVVERDGDLLGDGVNVAARLESLSPPGGVCVSRSVHEAVLNKVGATFRELGPRSLKNLPQPVHAFTIAPPGPPAGPAALALAPDELRAGPLPEAEPRPARNRTYRTVLGRLAVAGCVLVPAAVLLLAGEDGRRLFGGLLAEPPGPAAPAPAERPEPGRDRAPEPARAPAARPPRGADAKPAEKRSPSELAAAFAALARDGIVPDAKTLPELYHNARVHEARGEFGPALKAYAAAMPLAGESFDVPLRYAALLRAREGTLAARRVFAEFAKANVSRAAALANATLAEDDERAARLEGFAAANGDLAPVHFLLAEALLRPGKGEPTLTERRLAFDALDRFLDAVSTGTLAARFVDRPMLAEMIEAARRRRGEIEAGFAAAPARPTASFSRTNMGWLATVALPEPVTDVTYRLGERGDVLPAEAGAGGRTVEIELPAGTGRTALYLGYRDKAGRAAGPFALTFDPAAATAASGRQALERFPEAWVSFRPDLPDVLSYAGLVSNRCAIARARVGFNGEPPGSELELPPCDGAGSAALPSGSPATLTLPRGTEAVQVQLTFADGTDSPVRTFRRP